jgi:hypothetical protein
MENYEEAALRHYDDAHRLADLERYDNASHLIGIAAECALKTRIVHAGMSAKKVHLPEIVASYRNGMKGRTRGALIEANQLLDGPQSFSSWSIDDRYLGNGHVDQPLWDQRRRKTGALFAALGMRKKS